MSVEMVEVSVKAPEPTRPAGVLQQNRVFLDFFWDLAKPDQEVRLKAVQNLIQYLKNNNKADELEYTLKRLVDGLSHGREAARPGFSLALGQVLSAFIDISLHSTLERIKEKHNLQTVKKKLLRNAVFGNLFGILSLHQSGRLSTEPQVVLGCVQLLQHLSQYRQHLKDLPNKTMMEILNEVPGEVFEEVLLEALQTDLASAFRTPEQLQLLLVALQRFPQTLKPKKLKKLLGSSTVINADNVPRLIEVLKMAARSVKKDCVLPAVGLDLLKLSLKEDSFHLFWTEVITKAMFKEQAGPTHYLSFRLLGAALPFLSVDQLRDVLSGDVMMHYGEHVLSAQQSNRFKLSPEMDVYVSDFLQGCEDPDKQLAVMVGFSSLSNQGYPVVPSVWRVVQHLQPATLHTYVDWLQSMFLQPELDKLLDFSTRKQKDSQGCQENSIFRLRKWIVARLSSLIDNHQVKKPEGLIMGVARFIFFHGFFITKKACADIPESAGILSAPLDDRTRVVLVNSFFGLLMSLHHLPLLDDSADKVAANHKRPSGVTADGTMWIYHLVQYAKVLLSWSKCVESRQPLSAEQRQAWDTMLESVESLKRKMKKGQTAENSAFQQLFLLVGMHFFKAPEELLDVLKDLQSCVDRAQEKKSKKQKKQRATGQEKEPDWVEVMVDILLSLLSQPSRHMRQVCKTVFSSICPYVTADALTAILDVLDPEKSEEDSAVVVTEDNDTKKKMPKGDDEEEDVQMEIDQTDNDSVEEEEVDDDDNDDDDDDDADDSMEEDEEEEEGEVDQNFRLELMKVLQQQNALATEENGSDDDEELDDEAMMKLDQSLSALFSEQKKKTQAKRDEKSKIQKERTLLREFKIKVLDLVEVFVTRQAGSPLVLSLVEPLLTLIDKGMSSDSNQQEQDFLRRAADIFRNQLCRSKVYCKTAANRQGELHDLLEKLLTKSQKMSDSSVCLYYFSASLYLVKVLRGIPPTEAKEEHTSADLRFMGNVDVPRVSGLFRDALNSFMTRRKSSLSTKMFTDLFNRFPVLCVNLLDTAVQYITAGLREHQQGQACVLVLQALQSKEVQQLLGGDQWTELCVQVTSQITTSLQHFRYTESKVGKERLLKILELCHFVLKHSQQQKLSLDLQPIQNVLQPLTEVITFKKTGKVEDTYWAVMKYFGVMKPKTDKTKCDKEVNQQTVPKKKKGFLPETKKRKKRKATPTEAAGDTSSSTGGQKGQTKKDKTTKKKHQVGGAMASQASPAKKSKIQSNNELAKTVEKKKKKSKQKKEAH
ncbi:myb-binding protein 1A-like protein [Sphaeramia orbicularis]|uniref:Myb-binding protein 1A n=1 Tax=Sphaeramia orbicularis TaxID=375764 RepID=A0A672ZDV4_9TELE|nr:myb-binding protein 1A [Sphaeramia orbicularis]